MQQKYKLENNVFFQSNLDMMHININIEVLNHIFKYGIGFDIDNRFDVMGWYYGRYIPGVP